MRIVVTGVCGSGKTTLVARLRELGYEAYNVAQEHSCVKTLWRRKKPDMAVLLDATLLTISKRRNIAWGEAHLAEQRHRLDDVRRHADLYVPTDDLSKDDVVKRVIEFIGQHKITALH